MSLSRLASVSAYSTSVSASVSTISSRPAPNDPSASVGGTDEDDARISLLSSSPLPEVAAVKKAKRAMAANTSSPKTATSPPDTSQLGSIDNAPKPASPAATRSESTAPPPRSGGIAQQGVTYSINGSNRTVDGGRAGLPNHARHCVGSRRSQRSKRPRPCFRLKSCARDC